MKTKLKKEKSAVDHVTISSDNIIMLAVEERHKRPRFNPDSHHRLNGDERCQSSDFQDFMELGRQSSNNRRHKVFAEITIQTQTITRTHTNLSTSRKENRDPRPSMANSSLDGPKDTRKRKLSETTTATKESATTKKLKASNGEPFAEKTVNGGESLDHGKKEVFTGPTFYCHQCSKKRETTSMCYRDRFNQPV